MVKKPAFFIAVSLFMYSCNNSTTMNSNVNQHDTAKEQAIIAKRKHAAKTWASVVIKTQSQVITIFHDDSTASLTNMGYKDSLSAGGKTIPAIAITTENAKLTRVEADSVYVWTNALITEFTLPDKFCSDYAGYLRLTIAYNEQVRQSCEYKSICDWKLLAPETVKLNALLKNKFSTLK